MDFRKSRLTVKETNKMGKTRIEWLDGARGIAIFLVVLGHVLRGLPENADGPREWAAFLDSWIYTFHMPVFFFISGLFIESSAKRPLNSFIVSKLRTIAYPYFVWSIFQELLRILSGGSTLSGLWKIIYQPVMQYWFLYVLFLLGLLYALTRKVRFPVWFFAVVVLTLYALPQFGVNLGYWGVIYMTALNGIYFAGGALEGIERFSRHCQFKNLFAELTLSFTGFLFLVIAVAFAWEENGVMKPVLGFVGTVATLFMANALYRADIAKFLVYWGNLSLEIFVAHTIFSATVRELLLVMGIKLMALHILLPLFAGIAGPILLVRILSRLRINFAFTWPKTLFIRG